MSVRRKLFGIGLNKTGTSTLGLCLTQLGYRHQSHSGAALAEFAARQLTRVVDRARDFDSCEDWPWPLVWRELYWRYPDARFVLTVRSSAETWVESLKAHSLNTHPVRPMRRTVFGHLYPHGYEAEHIAAYERHNAAVRAFFAREAPDALIELCWEKGDGWAELCAFLGEAVPDAPFPHVRPRESGVDPAIRATNAANIAAQLARIAEHGREIVRAPLMGGII